MRFLILVFKWMCVTYQRIASPCVSLLQQSHPSAPCMSWASAWLDWRTRSAMRSWTWGPSANCPSSTACSRSTRTQRMTTFTRSRQLTSWRYDAPTYRQGRTFGLWLNVLHFMSLYNSMMWTEAVNVWNRSFDSMDITSTVTTRNYSRPHLQALASHRTNWHGCNYM